VQVHLMRLDRFLQRHLILSVLAQPKVLLRLRYLFSKLLIHLHMSVILKQPCIELQQKMPAAPAHVRDSTTQGFVQFTSHIKQVNGAGSCDVPKQILAAAPDLVCARTTQGTPMPTIPLQQVLDTSTQECNTSQQNSFTVNKKKSVGGFKYSS